MAIMDAMSIRAVLPIMTIIVLMATIPLMISVNNNESCFIGDVIDNSFYGYGHNGSSSHNICNGHIDCYDHIVVMTKHSLLIAVIAV